jgi:hypothetical protein
VWSTPEHSRWMRCAAKHRTAVMSLNQNACEKSHWSQVFVLYAPRSFAKLQWFAIVRGAPFPWVCVYP